MGRTVQVEQLLAGVRDTSGVALASGQVYFYEPGTTTQRNVWVDELKATTVTQPQLLDAAGRALVYADGHYRVVVQDSEGATIYDWDGLRFYFGDSDTIFGGMARYHGDELRIWVNPAPSEYSAGDRFFFKVSKTNIDYPITLAVNDLPPKNIVYKGLDNGGPLRRSWHEGQILHVIYDGQQFRILNMDSAEYNYTEWTFVPDGSMTFTKDNGLNFAYHRIHGNYLDIWGHFAGVIGGTPSNYMAFNVDHLGLEPSYTTSATYGNTMGECAIKEGTNERIAGLVALDVATLDFRIYKYDGSNYTAGNFDGGFRVVTQVYEL